MPTIARKNGVVAFSGGNRSLVPFNGGIATTSLRTGLAMTGEFKRSVKHPFPNPLNWAVRRGPDCQWNPGDFPEAGWALGLFISI